MAANVHLNFAARLNQGTVGVEAQCFPGVGVQDRVNLLALSTAQPDTPQAAIAQGVRYVEVITDAKVYVWAGPQAAGADNAARAAARLLRAMVIDTARTFEVSAGDVVHVWAFA